MFKCYIRFPIDPFPFPLLYQASSVLTQTPSYLYQHLTYTTLKVNSLSFTSTVIAAYSIITSLLHTQPPLTPLLHFTITLPHSLLRYFTLTHYSLLLSYYLSSFHKFIRFPIYRGTHPEFLMCLLLTSSSYTLPILYG